MVEFLNNFKLTAEIYGLIFGVSFILWMRWHIRNDKTKDLEKRLHRMIATMMSKKYFAWAVITTMFWYDHFVLGNFGEDSLAFESYLAFTCVTFGIDVWQKNIGLGKSNASS